MIREWSEKEVTRLQQLRSEGHSTSEIAQTMGRSRGAICAKLSRVRQKGDKEVTASKVKISATVPGDRRSPTVRKSEKRLPPTPVEQVERRSSPVRSRKVPLLDIGPFECRWIDPKPGQDGLATCCGHKVPSTPGLMFCDYHRQLSKGEGTESERRALSNLRRHLRKEAA